MKYRIASKIACRLLAIYFFILSLNYIPNMIITLIFNRDEFSGNLLSNLPWFLSVTIMLLTAILLWVFADKISVAIVNEVPENMEGIEKDYDKIAIVAFTVAGIFVLTKAIPDAVRIIIEHNLRLSSQLNYKETNMYIDSLSRIIGEIVQVGIGIWLTFGANGIYNMIKSFRNLGTDRVESR